MNNIQDLDGRLILEKISMN